MVRGVFAITGNICSGKSTVLAYLAKEGHKKLEVLLKPGEELTFLPETAHNTALRDLFYEDLRKGTNLNAGLFEIHCAVNRILTARIANKKKGIVGIDRTAIEGRVTFVRNSFNTIQKNGQRLVDNIYLGVYDLLLRLGIQQRGIATEDLIAYFQVKDPAVLKTRNKKRGENIPLKYFARLNKLYEESFGSQETVERTYQQWGIKIPKLLIIDASTDLYETPEYLDDVTDQIVAAMKPILRKNDN